MNSPLSRKTIAFGIMICAAVWFLQAGVDLVIFGQGDGRYLTAIVAPEPYALWTRFLSIFFVAVIAGIANKFVSHRKLTEKSENISSNFNRKILDSLKDAVAIINVADYRIIQANSMFIKDVGLPQDEVVGHTCFAVIHGRNEACSIEENTCPLLESAATGCLCQIHHVHRDGDVYRDVEINASPVDSSDGIIKQIVYISRDVTERKKFEREIERLAYFDALTALPNRLLFVDRLNQAITHAERDGQMLGVLFLDLDRFKGINDTLGHSFGDKILVEAADRLRSCIRKADTVARLGGDEFVVVLSNINHEDDISVIAAKILKSLAVPVVLGGYEVCCTASIGIAVFPRDGKEIDILLRNADTAMYQAKERGRDTCQFFSQEMNVRAVKRLAMETGLRHALARGEFFLNYLPQVNLEDGSVTGVEALLRWRNADNELIPPSHFIKLADETGLIVPIGEWVLRTACSQFVQWQKAGLPSFRMAVNISARQLRQKDFVASVSRIFRETGFDPQNLEIEITESTIMENGDESRDVLVELKSLGIGLSVDDFGTGYLSLNNLHNIPLDRIKIDRSFVREISSQLDNAAIANAIISLSRSLGLQVIAEGVETEAQLRMLHASSCHEAQGFLLTHPLDAESIPMFVKSAGANSCYQFGWPASRATSFLPV